MKTSPCPPVKKFRVFESPNDETIQSKVFVYSKLASYNNSIGFMELSVTSLDEPPQSRLLRKIDPMMAEYMQHPCIL